MLIDKAKAFAKHHHQGQVDKAGQDYMLHVIEVYENVCRSGGSTSAKVAALLHDVVEDTSVDLVTVEAEFGSRVAEIVSLVTKPHPYDEKAYFDAIKADNDARVVKLADLSHNSDLSRIANPSAKDVERTEKYFSKIRFLKGETNKI